MTSSVCDNGCLPASPPCHRLKVITWKDSAELFAGHKADSQLTKQTSQTTVRSKRDRIRFPNKHSLFICQYLQTKTKE
jgi:hypothetical protein